MKTIISFLLLVLLLIGSGSLVYADSIVPPRDYQIEVGSGEYIFDITTGRIKTGRNYFRFAPYILLGGVFVLGSLLWWRKSKGGK